MIKLILTVEGPRADIDLKSDEEGTLEEHVLMEDQLNALSRQMIRRMYATELGLTVSEDSRIDNTKGKGSMQ